jgi:hypothetical protein
MDVANQAGGSRSDADIGHVPMARFATPDDVARAFALLADSDQSIFIKGRVLAVEGTWTPDGSWDSLRLRKRWPIRSQPMGFVERKGTWSFVSCYTSPTCRVLGQVDC